MPRGDGSGPMGMGPMTGHAAGFCSGYGVSEYINPAAGCGFGFGRGRGMGFRRGGGFGAMLRVMNPIVAKEKKPERRICYLENVQGHAKIKQ